MPILKSFLEVPDMIDVFRKYPEGVWPLCEFHDIKLRGESPLSVSERELIAAYVSGVNACKFCFGAHKQIAELHGVDSSVFEKIMADPSQAPIDAKLLPILAYVRKLTETPSRMTEKDAEAVYAAGWSERALYDAIVVCALFNFMNRLVDGCGIAAKDARMAGVRENLAKSGDDGQFYRNFARLVLGHTETGT